MNPSPADPNFPKDLSIKPSEPIPDENNDGELYHHQPFCVDAQQSAIEKYGIAGRVWEGAYAFKDYLSDSSDLEFDPRPPFKENSSTIVELGSGTGIVAANMAQRLRSDRDILVATDLPEICPLLQENLQSFSEIVKVRQLAWGNARHAQSIFSEFLEISQDHRGVRERNLTHILCSDLVYFPELFGPLLRSLICLTSPPFFFPSSTSEIVPKLFISYKIRNFLKETPFWSAFGLWFDFAPVLAKRKGTRDWDHFGRTCTDAMFLFHARRRPESFAWIIPDEDELLVAGVGAKGSKERKSDETFEILLLMRMGES